MFLCIGVLELMILDQPRGLLDEALRLKHSETPCVPIKQKYNYLVYLIIQQIKIKMKGPNVMKETRFLNLISPNACENGITVTMPMLNSSNFCFTLFLFFLLNYKG